LDVSRNVFESVGCDLCETLEDCSAERYSSQVWSGQL